MEKTFIYVVPIDEIDRVKLENMKSEDIKKIELAERHSVKEFMDGLNDETIDIDVSWVTSRVEEV